MNLDCDFLISLHWEILCNAQIGFRDTTARHTTASTLLLATLPRTTLSRVTFTARDTTANFILNFVK